MSHIEPRHVRVFQTIRSQRYDNITLSSCRINGKPGAAIVMIDQVGEGKVGVMPLFLGYDQSWMTLEFEGDNSPGSPARGSVSRRTQTKKRKGMRHDAKFYQTARRDRFSACHFAS